MKTLRIFGLCLALILSACTSLTSTPSGNPTLTASTPTLASTSWSTPVLTTTPEANATQSTPPGNNDAILAAKTALATLVDVDLSLIEVKSVETVEWSDSCLGVESKNEMCLDVITPGFRIILIANAHNYEYHTDSSGKSVHLASTPNLPLNLPGQATPTPGAPLL